MRIAWPNLIERTRRKRLLNVSSREVILRPMTDRAVVAENSLARSYETLASGDWPGAAMRSRMPGDLGESPEGARRYAHTRRRRKSQRAVPSPAIHFDADCDRQSCS